MAKMKTNHKHYSAGAVIWIVIKYFSLVFFSFVALLPIVSCVITAFKTDAEYQSTNVMTLPESWLNFQNFIDAFNRANMGRAYLNSAIILVFVLLGSVLVGTQLAYVLNRFKFPGNGLIRSLFLFATLLPGIAMQVSVYQIMSNLGFINHLYGYIIMSMGTDVISIYIFIQFMENISVSLDESAFIDGASYFTIYWKIILPLVVPGIAAVAIFVLINGWNEYMYSSVLISKDALKTLTVGIVSLNTQNQVHWNDMMAASSMSCLPLIILFLCFQKYFIAGMTSGAVKS